MTREEAEAFVRSCGESDGPESYDEAAELFAAIFDRRADDDDGDQGDLWSQICAAVVAVRYEVRPVADAECTRVHDTVLGSSATLHEAKRIAGGATACMYGAAVVDTETGEIDWGYTADQLANLRGGDGQS